MAIAAKWADELQHDEVERCMCCNREVGENSRWVCVIGGGCEVASSRDEIDESDPGYMGWFAVGSTCAKKHFADALFE